VADDAEVTVAEEAAAPATDPDAPPAPEPVSPPAAAEVDTEPGGSQEAAGSAADSVFARLRAEQGAGEEQPVEDDEPTPSEPAPVDEAPHVDAAARPFLARRAALESVDKELGRRLKRGLADEQNEVLDLLRRAKPTGVDDLLPGVDEHAARWADAVTATLAEAAAAGADWSGGTASPIADLADELARSLTGPLRERIDRSFAASDGNLDDVADRVRALYREWKGKRLTETSGHYVVAAYARGVYDGVAPDALVRWVVDPSAGPCPDCDDNVLAGHVTKGSEFPTGNPCAPAHPGCHCLVLAVEH
jgi:hypothetical protein